MSEEPDTVEEVYEPFLLKQGLLLRTPRGRVATAAAYAHLGSRPRRPGPTERCGGPVPHRFLSPPPGLAPGWP